MKYVRFLNLLLSFSKFGSVAVNGMIVILLHKSPLVFIYVIKYFSLF